MTSLNKPPNGTAAANEPKQQTTAAGNQPGRPIPFVYSFPVWGKQYVDYLCKFAIPSLLAPKNLPALKNNGVSTFLICTTPEDRSRIQAAPIFKALSALINVEFFDLPAVSDTLPGPDNLAEKYSLLMRGHAVAAMRAKGRGCAVFLGPDAIYSDGMLPRLYELVSNGKTAVVGMGLRVIEETIVPALVKQNILRESEPLSLQPRQAVNLLVQHLHEDARIMRWDSPYFPWSPYMAIWDSPAGDGVLVRSYSLHPYILDYRAVSGHRVSPSETAIDAGFLTECLIPPAQVYQVLDSDEFVVLSLSHIDRREYQRHSNVNRLAALCQSAYRQDITMLNRIFFMNAIKFHAGDLDHHWAQLEQDSLEIAYKALAQSPQAPPLDLARVSGWVAVRVVLSKIGEKLKSWTGR